MPTTFKAISLGNVASIDPAEGHATAGNVSCLTGKTFGGAGDALVNNVVSMSLASERGGHPNVYDLNNKARRCTFSIDGGVPQTFDIMSVYNATLTYIDGTKAQIAAMVFRGNAGNIFLLPEFTTTNQAALETGPIWSIMLNSVVGEGPSGTATRRSSSDNFASSFVKGTTLHTAQGLVPVEDLTAGLPILTMDHGFQPIRWVGSRTVKAKGAFSPIRICAGALGNDEDLWVSPQHRMVLSEWRADMLHGVGEVLAPAISLVNGRDIIQCPSDEGTYYAVMLDQHELVYAAGVASESFYPGVRAMAALDVAAREEVLALFPMLRWFGSVAYGDVARPVAHTFEAQLLAG